MLFCHVFPSFILSSFVAKGIFSLRQSYPLYITLNQKRNSPFQNIYTLDRSFSCFFLFSGSLIIYTILKSQALYYWCVELSRDHRSFNFYFLHRGGLYSLPVPICFTVAAALVVAVAIVSNFNCSKGGVWGRLV